MHPPRGLRRSALERRRPGLRPGLEHGSTAASLGAPRAQRRRCRFGDFGFGSRHPPSISDRRRRRPGAAAPPRTRTPRTARASSCGSRAKSSGSESGPVDSKRAETIFVKPSRSRAVSSRPAGRRAKRHLGFLPASFTGGSFVVEHHQMARRELGESVTEIRAGRSPGSGRTRCRLGKRGKSDIFQSVLFLELLKEIFVRRPAFDAPRELAIGQNRASAARSCHTASSC